MISDRCWSAVVALALAVGASASSAQVRDSKALIEALRAPSSRAGFCVDLGCGDGALMAELAKSDRYTIHALEADEQQVQRALQMLQHRLLYGQVVVEVWSS